MPTMTIRVVCKQCQAKMDIRAELAGSTRKCPKCKTEFVVPQPGEETPATMSTDTADMVSQSFGTAERAVSDVIPAKSDSAERPTVSDDVQSAPPKTATNDDEEDDDDDYMPSFLTADQDDRKAQKTPLPPTAKSKSGDDDEEPMLSIPKTPLAPKPKFKTFDPDDFAEEEAPRPRKREVPASLEDDRPKRNRRDDDFDEEPPRRGGGSGNRAGGRELNLPNPGSTGLSDPGAGAMSGGTKDRAQAARELRQALKDSALRAPPEPEAKPGIFVDLADLASEIGLKGVAIVVGVVILLPAMYFLSDYFMGGGPKLPKLGYVTGTVTYDGAPTAGVEVKFEPRDKEGQLIPKMRTSVGITDEKGQYQLNYMEGVTGVAVGSCRVTLALPPPLFVPEEYSPNSRTMKDVAAGNQKVDFSLAAPPKRR